MNTGIGDAINLAWKLKAVLAGQASEAILDTYETERRAFTLATAEGHVADFIRTRIIPLVVPTLFKFEVARNYMFSVVSQIVIAYHDSAISEGKVGHIRGGDRLPWAPAPDVDNFDTFQTIGWQLRVYGTASLELSNWCNTNNLRLNVFPWRETYEKPGLLESAMYLLRPDTYIALVAREQDPDILRRYFADHGLSLTN